MQLPNPKELDAILKVCRKRGVTDLKCGELELKLGELPKDGEREEADGVALGGPTEEELLFWSAAPDPLEGRQ